MLIIEDTNTYQHNQQGLLLFDFYLIYIKYKKE